MHAMGELHKQLGVLLGEPYYSDRHLQGIRKASDRPTYSGFPHDSVVAGTGPRLAGVGVPDRQVHREFIVYDRVQVYPEYLIYFEV